MYVYTYICIYRIFSPLPLSPTHRYDKSLITLEGAKSDKITEWDAVLMLFAGFFCRLVVYLTFFLKKPFSRKCLPLKHDCC